MKKVQKKAQKKSKRQRVVCNIDATNGIESGICFG